MDANMQIQTMRHSSREVTHCEPTAYATNKPKGASLGTCCSKKRCLSPESLALPNYLGDCKKCSMLGLA
jgi:hypothetical protein